MGAPPRDASPKKFYSILIILEFLPSYELLFTTESYLNISTCHTLQMASRKLSFSRLNLQLTYTRWDKINKSNGRLPINWAAGGIRSHGGRATVDEEHHKRIIISISCTNMVESPIALNLHLSGDGRVPSQWPTIKPRNRVGGSDIMNDG